MVIFSAIYLTASFMSFQQGLLESRSHGSTIFLALHLVAWIRAISAGMTYIVHHLDLNTRYAILIDMDDHFYSTTACNLISNWPAEVAKLVHEFALKNPKREQQQQKLPHKVTPEELNEAREDSHGLLQNCCSAYVERQKTLNQIEKKQAKLAEDLELLTDAIQHRLNTPADEEISLTELDNLYTEISKQQELPEKVQQQIEEWRNQELTPLISKWQDTWQQHREKHVAELVKTLKDKHNIELGSMEQNELLQPTKNRAELLLELKRFYPQGLPKGFKEKSSLFKLRALWALAAHRKQTLTG